MCGSGWLCGCGWLQGCVSGREVRHETFLVRCLTESRRADGRRCAIRTTRTLYTLHTTLYTLHSTLHTPHSTLHTPQPRAKTVPSRRLLGREACRLRQWTSPLALSTRPDVVTHCTRRISRLARSPTHLIHRTLKKMQSRLLLLPSCTFTVQLKASSVTQGSGGCG